jgi:YidC/Oxa1 family membrane protein insertase
MAKMKLITPRMTKIREMYGDDRQKMNPGDDGALQDRENQSAGRLLSRSWYRFRYSSRCTGCCSRRSSCGHAPFVLWIKDLSALDPYYVLPVLMTVTMVIQTKLNPVPPDPVQAKVMQFMPFIFSIFFFFFPAGPGALLAGQQHPFHPSAMADPAHVRSRQTCPCQAVSSGTRSQH